MKILCRNTIMANMRCLASQGVPPKARAVLAMALASSIHFAAYELAKSGTLALFTSKRSGFTNASAAPFAMACVSPFSILLLWLYTRSLRQGPKAALMHTTMLFVGVLMTASFGLWWIDPLVGESELHHGMSRLLLFGLFVGQMGLVQLLHAEHWSFLSSTAPRVWFAPIAGIGSLTSTVAALSVSGLVAMVGLTGLLFVAALLLSASAYFASDAYDVADKHDLLLDQDLTIKKASKPKSKESPILQAKALFQRVPVFKTLCAEVFTYQVQSSLLDFLYFLQVKNAITNDQERASWTGNCHAWIHVSTGVMQFFVLPVLLTRSKKSQHLWLIMPSIMLACASYLTLTNPTLQGVSLSFSLLKTLEYSLRGTVTETLYASLDYESRFVGKEIVGLFANRLSKSGMAMGLSLAAYFGYQPPITAWFMACVAWMLVANRLSKHIKDKVE